MTPRRRAVIGGAALTLALGLLLGGCGQLWFPTSVTRQGDDTTRLWRIFVWVAAVIGLLVYGLVTFAVVRYRRRRHDDGAPPSQRQYHIPLEVLWTAVPLVLVLVLYLLSVRTEQRITRLDPNPALTVEVIGFQWQWQFRYPETGIVVTGVPGEGPPTLVLPVDRTVRLKLISNDVIHSFWVPHFIEKRDLIPGIDNQIDVDITQAGEWSGVCSEFCGLDHWKMNFALRALPPEQFDAWVAAGGKT